MKFSRTGNANWKGNGLEGKGTLTTHSGALKDVPYSTSSRFEDGIGTNPEELIAAAHAGCFTMKLSFVLAEAGFTATNLDTKARAHFEDGVINRVTLSLDAVVPGISEEELEKLADEAKRECPISKSLTAEVVLKCRLHEAVA